MDEIVRMIAKNAPVKAMAITGRNMVERAREIHRTLPVVTAALGRSLMACSMMGDQLKGEGASVTLRIKGDGPMGSLTAVSDTEGNARGFVQNPAVTLPLKDNGKLDVGSVVGREGTLTVIKDLEMREPYVGMAPLVSGEIAEDVTAYFAVSEQIPTACALGVLVDTDQSVLRAGGYLIQLLPGAGEETIEKVERGVAALGPVTSALLEEGMDGEGLLRRALGEFDLEVLERHPVEYRCYCSRQRVTQALVSMGPDELRSLIEEQGKAELTCQFCDAVYEFSREELEGLLPG
ncbi:MAG: Hsp33 family molecular chaperone HslO [Oscillospiraceae bacterium]|jgi:molecular chaperone Hsp33|nr:Hsp33 family molecular chaperone HslO [Oscillospiraceae bacterium]